MLFEDGLKKHGENFLNKCIEDEYHVYRASETLVKINFLQPFDNHGLLKCIGLSKKFSPNNLKDFYSKVKINIIGLEFQFHAKYVAFTHEDFHT